MLIDSIGNLLGFHENTLWQEYNPSPNAVVILSFDSIFLETDNDKGMIFKRRRSGIIHKWTRTVDSKRKTKKKLREVSLGL